MLLLCFITRQFLLLLIGICVNHLVASGAGAPHIRKICLSLIIPLVLKVEPQICKSATAHQKWLNLRTRKNMNTDSVRGQIKSFPESMFSCHQDIVSCLSGYCIMQRQVLKKQNTKRNNDNYH